MTQRLDNPFPLFLAPDGTPLQNGYVYMGEAGKDPESYPLDTYWNEALSITAEQPFRTRGGYIVDGANTAFVFAAGDDYSLRVRDASGGEVLYFSSVAVAGQQFQPLDSDLTAIAALTTTAFGRALLTLANQAALKAATGIPDPLPAAGGVVTGNITRQGAGAHTYHNDATLTSGRIFVTAHDAADPTSLPGDIWLKRAAP
ncbi:hypothetical protein L7H23_01250 [Sphingopyxis sp. BSN-002]|uniref:hypothetical protein n=1 Tax=Sphingopyxis sp. BSN-002 TaxID=2911495 RepID=UPI001EDC24E9|nr:hypothetical protein [Sphingopyxis sp. BSN-002]QVJ07695.1 pectate lyase superfamily protein [Sphingopyxis phage VSN-002]UKK84759.1 hypothetical protein L7H23_01250 [Sphingopyxis sp. BSN-002]